MDVQALIERYNDAWNRQDLDAIAARARGDEWDGVDVFPLADGLIRRKDVYSASHRPREPKD